MKIFNKNIITLLLIGVSALFLSCKDSSKTIPFDKENTSTFYFFRHAEKTEQTQ